MHSRPLLIVLSIPLVRAFVPLADKNISWFDIPYQADTDPELARGPQSGYNICNSTTEGPTSLCQTSYLNSLDDFCIWAPPEPGQTVGQIEGQMVAWCTKSGHGSRIMPAGTLTGVQLTKTPDYIQVVGFMNQTLIDMVAGDEGGEMDPHGADGRGNPIGGLVFSDAWTGTYLQAVQWNDFNGGNSFCFKACDPRGPNAAGYCINIYDTEGCDFNSPSNAQDGVFESCAGDSQNPPGVGAPTVPASSLCSQYHSTDIYGGGTQVPVPGASTISFSSTPTPTSTQTSSAASRTATNPTTGSKTASGADAGATQTSSAGVVHISVTLRVTSILAFALFFL